MERDSSFVWRVVQSLLNDYFSPSFHDEVLREVGLLGKIGQVS